MDYKSPICRSAAPVADSSDDLKDSVVNKTAHRIVHVITSSQPFGGAQRNTLLTLKGLVTDGYEVELICGPGGQLIPEAQSLGVSVHILRDLVRPLSPFKDMCALFRLYQIYRSRRYQLVHTHSIKAGLLGRLAAWLARVPMVVHTIHGAPFVIGNDLRSKVYFLYERLLGYLTQRVICVGEVLRQEVMAWKVLPAEKLTTIYSGIDFSSCVPRQTVVEMKQKLGLEEAWPIVGCVGRLTEQKAQQYLVEAIALLKPKYPEIKLMLVGDGELRPLLEKRIQELGHSSNVCLLGERDDVVDLLNILDVYAMSSRWEGVGRALTEAMYMGIPIVATSVNGVTEVISHEKTGLLVSPDDSCGLAGAIDRLVSDRELAKRFGSTAHQKAKAIMDGQQMVVAIEELYEKLAGAQSLATGWDPTRARNSES